MLLADLYITFPGFGNPREPNRLRSLCAAPHVCDGRELHQFEQAVCTTLEDCRMHAPIVTTIGQQAREVKAEADIGVAVVLPGAAVAARAVAGSDFDIAQKPVLAQRRKTIGLDHEQKLLRRIIAERIEIRRT